MRMIFRVVIDVDYDRRKIILRIKKINEDRI